MTQSIVPLLEKAIHARSHLFDAHHESAFRIFNGFSEGQPHLSLDLYGSTVLFHNYHPDAAAGMALVHEAQNFIRNHALLSKRLHAGVVKSRNSGLLRERRGTLLFGEKQDRKIREHGVWYAVALTLNRDASLYLDTGNLRKWLIENTQGKSVLNTFAYTGSLGVAALAGGARRVIQIDRNHQFLNIAKQSCTLNGFPINGDDLVAADFFPAISRFKHAKQSFDCILIDPPFFSITPKGRVDQENNSARLINKVRPLIHDGGCLIAINNALYVSGKEYLQVLDSLCRDGYLEIKELIPVPQDFTGFDPIGSQITDPAPFNHSTKIAILSVKRK